MSKNEQEAAKRVLSRASYEEYMTARRAAVAERYRELRQSTQGASFSRLVTLLSCEMKMSYSGVVYALRQSGITPQSPGEK